MSSDTQILHDYGITENSLSERERQELDNRGFFVFPDILDSSSLERLRIAFERECEKDGKPAVVKETGTRHIPDLVNRDSVFDGIYTHSKILAAAYHILRDRFRVGQVGGRDPLPGYGQQGLHADWTARCKGEPFRTVTAIWLLDDFTKENGATRVVPGTHRLLTSPPKSFTDPASRHPEQTIIVANAGSVLVFNGHLWHSGTTNRSRGSRRVVQCTFVGLGELRHSRIDVEAPDRLSTVARHVLGMPTSQPAAQE